jgi:hypothetical protein
MQTGGQRHSRASECCGIGLDVMMKKYVTLAVTKVHDPVHSNFCLSILKREFTVGLQLWSVINWLSGFGGLEVSVLAFGTRVRGFKAGLSRRIFRAKKILSTPSFGGEVKPSVPCRKFTARKTTQKWRGSRHFRKNSRKFLAHNSTFRCWGSLASFQTWGTPGGGSWNVLITGPPSWGFDVPLATALCKNLPAQNTQR